MMDYLMNSETLARRTEISVAVAKVRNRTRHEIISEKSNHEAAYKDATGAYTMGSPIRF